MRKFWLALVLSLMPLVASAAYPCVPGFYGTTLDVSIPKRSDAGWRVVWLCQNNGPKAEYLVCTHGVCNLQLFKDTLDAAVKAADPAQAIKDAIAQYATQTCGTTTDTNLKTVCAEAQAQGQAMLAAYMGWKEVPVEVWKVSPYSTYTTRPAYPVVNGVRGTESNGRAAVGSSCDCKVKFPLTASTAYCLVNSTTDQVSVCKMQ